MKTLIVLLAFILNFNIMMPQVHEDLDEIAPYQEDFAAIKKSDQWAFINRDGEVVIDYRSDLVSSISENDLQMTTSKFRSYPHFVEGKCLIKKLTNGIYYYGFIDTKGNEVIAPEYVNATNFKNGKSIVVKYEMIPVGENKVLGKGLVTYRLVEYVINAEGTIIKTMFNFRKIVPKVVQGEIPPAIKSKFIGSDMIASEFENDKWQIDKL